MKHCPKCEKTKSANEFHNNSSRPDGKNGFCKQCMKPYHKTQQHKEAARKRQAGTEDARKSSLDFTSLPDEIWVDIDGYEGQYQISNLGRVRSIFKKWNIKRVSINKQSGYAYLGLTTSDGAHRTHYLHRLLAKAFIPNPMNYEVVNHKNGIKHDNLLSNLEWCTQQQNIVHAIKVLERHFALSQNRTPKCLQTKETKRQISKFYYQAKKKTKETGIKHVVDHIHPLNGVNCMGLHVPWNLQVITKLENEQKNNKLLIVPHHAVQR